MAFWSNVGYFSQKFDFRGKAVLINLDIKFKCWTIFNPYRNPPSSLLEEVLNWFKNTKSPFYNNHPFFLFDQNNLKKIFWKRENKLNFNSLPLGPSLNPLNMFKLSIFEKETFILERKDKKNWKDFSKKMRRNPIKIFLFKSVKFFARNFLTKKMFQRSQLKREKWKYDFWEPAKF